jgi:hypothetical protein
MEFVTPSVTILLNCSEHSSGLLPFCQADVGTFSFYQASRSMQCSFEVFISSFSSDSCGLRGRDDSKPGCSSAQVFLGTWVCPLQRTVTRVVCLEHGCRASPAFSQLKFFLQGCEAGELAPNVGRDRGGVRPGAGGLRGGGAEGGRCKHTLNHNWSNTQDRVKPFNLDPRVELYSTGRLNSKVCSAGGEGSRIKLQHGLQTYHNAHCSREGRPAGCLTSSLFSPSRSCFLCIRRHKTTVLESPN